MQMKQTRGRQRIKIKKIEEKDRLHVTFSKRRSGFFKKAAELSVLCGADVAVLVQSPGNKLFAFGSPSVDVVLNRYLSSNCCYGHGSNESEKKLEGDDHMVKVEEEKEGGGVWWRGWDANGEDFGYDYEGGAEEYVEAMEDLRKKVLARSNELTEAGVVDGNLALPLSFLATDATAGSCGGSNATDFDYDGISSEF